MRVAAGRTAEGQGDAVSLPPAPSGSDPDDLEAIRRVGPIVRKKLDELGIRTFAQLAALGPPQVVAVEQAIGFPGRIGRERWIEQARERIEGD